MSEQDQEATSQGAATDATRTEIATRLLAGILAHQGALTNLPNAVHIAVKSTDALIAALSK